MFGDFKNDYQKENITLVLASVNGSRNYCDSILLSIYLQGGKK